RRGPTLGGRLAGGARAGAAGRRPGSQGLGRRRCGARSTQASRRCGGGHPARSTMDDRGWALVMPGNSERRGRRTTSKKGSSAGSGGRNRDALKGRGRTLPADERPWHKGYSGDEKLPQRTAWKQDKERKAAAAEGRAPKIGQPGTKATRNWSESRGGPARTGTRGAGAARSGAVARTGGPRVAPGRKSVAPRDAPDLLVGRNPVVEALRAHVPATAL